MARPIKSGLDYFPFNVDFFEDDKIAFCSARFDEKGELIAVKLLCKIYKNGYFIKWDNDTALLFAKSAGKNITPGLVNEVVNELLKRGFFDETLHRRFAILTSHGIQKRYLKICKDSNRKDFEIPEKFTASELSPENSEFPPGETSESQEEITQRKGKEIKEKEKKEKEITCDFDFFWDSYDKKVDRPKCEKKWGNLSESDKEAVLNFIPLYKISQPDKQFRKDPATFLNNRSWENELISKSNNREQEQIQRTGKLLIERYGNKNTRENTGGEENPSAQNAIG